jgi:hypothetical protein
MPINKKSITPKVGIQDPPPMPPHEEQQITNCLENSFIISNNYIPYAPESEYKRKVGITARNQEFVMRSLEHATNYPDLCPANVDPAKWASNMQSYNIFMVIWRLAHQLERLCWKAVRIFATRCFADFRNQYMFWKAEGKGGNVIAQTFYEEMKPYYARHSKNTTASTTSNDIIEMEVDEVKNISKNMLGKLKELGKLTSNITKKMREPVLIEKEQIDIKKEVIE